MQFNRGFGIVEVVIGASIIALITLGTAGAIHIYVKTGLAQTERVQAAYLLEEGLEAARFIRDTDFDDFASLALDTPYYIATSSSGWEATSTVVALGEFTRTLTLANIWRRDSDKDIVPATSGDPKTIDPDARRVTVEVLWSTQNGTASTSATTYLVDMFDE